MPLGSKTLEGMVDYLLLYAKNKDFIKYRQLFIEMNFEGDNIWKFVQLPDGSRRSLSLSEINNHSLLPKGSKVYRLVSMVPPTFNQEAVYEFIFNGKTYKPSGKGCWLTTKDKMDILAKANRLQEIGNTLNYVLFSDDFPYKKLTNLWESTTGPSIRNYIVETSSNIIERCILMTTDPGDLVFDPTCGSGTTAYVAEQWGRRWITCDTSRVAVTLAKQRLMTALFDYYKLAHPEEGVGSGFVYETVPHITLKSIANNEPPATETLYDKPFIDKSKHRVTGPFTVEAVPSLTVKSIDEIDVGASPGFSATPDNSIARSGETLRQAEWREELFRTGIRGKNKQEIKFTRVEPLSGTKWLHADAETLPEAKSKNLFEKENQMTFDEQPQRVVISFGPAYAPLEQRQVALAIEEAQTLVPKPKIVVFAAFQFDPEAAKDIDETNWPGVTLLKVQMNADLLTDDLKKKRSSNESFWLIGSPDIKVTKIKEKIEANKNYAGERILYQVEVLGFDYYNTKTGNIESGGKDKIAMWMLDTDYDGRSLFPRQVFFPMSGEKDGWSRLAKNLKAEIDEELIEQYRGTISLPFEAGVNKRIAVKIVDDRGIESLKIVELN